LRYIIPQKTLVREGGTDHFLVSESWPSVDGLATLSPMGILQLYDSINASYYEAWVLN
jgi:hypothetical protein